MRVFVLVSSCNGARGMSSSLSPIIIMDPHGGVDGLVHCDYASFVLGTDSPHGEML